MHYMSNAPEAIAGDVFDSIEGARGGHHGRHGRVSGFGDLIGTSIEDRIKAEVARQAAAQIIEGAKDALTSGLGFGLNFNPLHALKSAVRLSARPFTYQANLANRLLHKAAHARLPGEGGGGGRGGGGGGGGAPAPDDGGAPDGGGGDQQQDDATEGLMGALQSAGAASRISYLEGISPGFTARLAAQLRARRGQGGAPPGWRARARAAATPAPSASAGFSLSHLFHRAKPAGKLLVSATPGGTTALQAHAIATKALKSGALKPDHLKKAGALTKAGRKGDDKALVKIAGIKAAAAKGNPHAAVALDRLKLANCLQTGGHCKPGTPAGGALSQSYSQGLAALAHRHA
jgi:hypothetical protein